jgi:hypothetical protein
MAEARHVSAAEAERWRLWPQLVRDTSSAAAGPAVVREERTVRVGATPEVWALVWRRRPAPMCGPEDMARALTCPCEGFAYGEQGELDLVRRAPSRTEERFALTPLFHDEESATQPEGLAALQRWPVLGTDYDGADSREIGAEVRARPVVRAMTFGDYDHDGRATEFLLQVGTGACGSRAAVLVGLSTAQPSLHAFTSVAHPEQPLVLHPAIWALLLRRSREVSGVERSCGDHGAETRTEVTLRVGAAGIDGTRAEYECAAGGARGKLVRSERI